MQQTSIFKQLIDLFRRNDRSDAWQGFAGPSLLDQEPELVHETARHGISAGS